MDNSFCSNPNEAEGAICQKKRQMRLRIEGLRQSYDGQTALQDAQTIVKKISRSTQFQKAKTVALYWSIRNELDINKLLDSFEVKNMLLPVCSQTEMTFHRYEGRASLRQGRFGIAEPVTPCWNGGIDLIIVPGVAFDHHKNRLGRGGGFYDKWLARHPNVYKMGICYDFQLVNEVIPTSAFDAKMDMIITPTRQI